MARGDITNRDLRGRARARYDDRTLYEIVRDVARHVDPQVPTRVSQRAFDAARSEAGWPDAPGSRAICLRLRSGDGRPMAWRRLLDLALSKDTNLDRVEVRRRATTANGFGPAHVRYALRRAAEHLGLSGGESLSPDLYTEARQQLLAAEGRRRSAHKPLNELLPTAGQVMVICTEEGQSHGVGWDRALALAELPPRAPAARVAGKRPRGYPLHLAVHEFLNANGTDRWPSHRTINAFGIELGIHIADRGAQPWREILDEARAYRQERGLPCPEGYPRRGRPVHGAQQFKVPPEGIPDAPRRDEKQKAWTKAECIAAIAAYLDELEPGVAPIKKHYMRTAVGNPERPSPSCFDDYGGWKKLLAAAKEGRD